MFLPPGHIMYHGVPTRPYHTPCHVLPGHAIYQCMSRQTIPFTILCPPGHAQQAIPYAMPCPPGYTIYHCLVIPYIMPCPPGHTFSHAIPARPYHIPCHASPCHNIYHALITRQYHIPYHTRQVIPYTMPCHSQRLLR